MKWHEAAGRQDIIRPPWAAQEGGVRSDGKWIRKSQHDWYTKNKERFLDYAKKYRETRTEDIARKSKEYWERVRHVTNARRNQDRKNNPEKYRSYARQYHRKKSLGRYGLSASDDRPLSLGCHICGVTHNDKRKRYFELDHDHTSGTARGFLCKRCNLLLGMAGDSVIILQKAISYLHNPPLKNGHTG